MVKMNGEKIKKIFGMPAVRTLCEGLALFVCAMMYVPSSGVLRTIPFFIVGGVVSQLLAVSVSTTAFMSAVFTLFLYLVDVRSVSSALFFAVIACLLSLSGVYLSKLFVIAKKTENKSVRKKAQSYMIFSVLIAIFLSVVLCGNAFSFVLRDKENMSYISDKYDENISKRYTCFEPLKGGYCTYVSLKDGNDVYGNDDTLYILAKETLYNDDVRNFYEDKMLSSANLALSEIITGATWGFNVVSSDIPFENGEVIDASSDVSDYLSRINYVVTFDSLVSKNEKDKFTAICADTFHEISRRNFEFGNIVFCAGDAKDVLFCVKVDMDTSVGEISSLVSVFDEEVILEYGADENVVLSYWENR